MNNVGMSASGVRNASWMARCASGQVLLHHLTSRTSPADDFAGASSGVEEDVVERGILRQALSLAQFGFQRTPVFPRERCGRRR